MKPEFLIERSGKQVVRYAGLLDLAHARGLKSLRTDLVQAPRKDNGQVAICRAVAELGAGAFTGFGDASPRSAPRSMAEQLIRCAETRAKARALRDALNIKLPTVEELGQNGESIEMVPAIPTPPDSQG